MERCCYVTPGKSKARCGDPASENDCLCKHHRIIATYYAELENQPFDKLNVDQLRSMFAEMGKQNATSIGVQR